MQCDICQFNFKDCPHPEQEKRPIAAGCSFFHMAPSHLDSNCYLRVTDDGYLEIRLWVGMSLKEYNEKIGKKLLGIGKTQLLLNTGCSCSLLTGKKCPAFPYGE